jgi:hypothetical protein
MMPGPQHPRHKVVNIGKLGGSALDRDVSEAIETFPF